MIRKVIYIGLLFGLIFIFLALIFFFKSDAALGWKIRDTSLFIVIGAFVIFHSLRGKGTMSILRTNIARSKEEELAYRLLMLLVFIFAGTIFGAIIFGILNRHFCGDISLWNSCLLPF